MSIDTIIVAGHFGDKEVTLEEFTDQWIEHFREFKRLSYDWEWLSSLEVFERQIRAKCKEEFYLTLTKQNQLEMEI